MKGDAEKARQAGCDGYIAKPIDTRAVPQIIREYLDAPRQTGTTCAPEQSGE